MTELAERLKTLQVRFELSLQTLPWACVMISMPGMSYSPNLELRFGFWTKYYFQPCAGSTQASGVVHCPRADYRARRGYPSIVDDAMVRHWSADARAGRPIEWSSARWHAEQQRQLHDPQLRAERASAGAHGAGGSSFGGGGGGGGGGGAGGGW